MIMCDDLMDLDQNEIIKQLRTKVQDLEQQILLRATDSRSKDSQIQNLRSIIREILKEKQNEST